eukprot:846488-Amphidinium_carterae.2
MSCCPFYGSTTDGSCRDTGTCEETSVTPHWLNTVITHPNPPIFMSLAVGWFFDAMKRSMPSSREKKRKERK